MLDSKSQDTGYGEINLHIEPKKKYTWEEFKKEKPPYSIALDGIVNAKTIIDIEDPERPYANFDHHSESDDLVTRATSAQVHMIINLGLFDIFKKDGKPYAEVFVNHCDEDADHSCWLLKHNDLVTHPNRVIVETINRLVHWEDKLDSTAGAYPLRDISMKKKMAWIFEPYKDARFKRILDEMDEGGMRDIIESVGNRITLYVNDKGQELELEGHYEIIGGGPGWSMVEETGSAARMAMYNDGIKTFVIVVSEKDGFFRYTFGNIGFGTKIYLPKIYERCNMEEERGIITDTNRWDGTTMKGGSPITTGSTIYPKKLEYIMNDEISKS